MDLAAIITAYDAIGVLSTNTQAAFATITGLGPIPPLPDVVSTNSEYTDAIAAQDTWRSNGNLHKANLESCIETQTAAEQSLLDSISSGDPVFPPMQWVCVTGLANWGVNSTQYISWPLVQRQVNGAQPLFMINSVLVAPLNPYPSLT